MHTDDLTYQRGLPERLRTDAAMLYDEAFGNKFAAAIPARAERLALLEAYFMPAYAIVAIADDTLAGLAGFHTTEGSFTGGCLSGTAPYRDLTDRLGLWRGNRAALIFSLYARQPAPGELLMDGLAVNRRFRSQGIGSRLLDEVARYARDSGYDRVRLDVIDTNPRAKKLYERKGFQVVKTERIPYLRWLLGFGGYTTMERIV